MEYIAANRDEWSSNHNANPDIWNKVSIAVMNEQEENLVLHLPHMFFVFLFAIYQQFTSYTLLVWVALVRHLPH